MIDDICSAAQAAGEIILRYYKRSIQVVTKSDSSPLSEADRASHNYLVAALERLTPDWPVVSEESSGKDQCAGTQSDRYWLVDPLDGTKEFLKGTDEFTVNIGLIDHGRPVLGVVFAPALNLTYFADVEKGAAWRKLGSESPTSIRTRKPDPARLALVASKDHAGPMVSKLLEQAPGAELKSMGSSLKFCLVADGSADLYLRDVPTMEWDTAAADCVVRAAGGQICTLDGNLLSYGKTGLKNPSIVTVGDPCFDWASLVR